jgi:glycine/D-amino acid oxidase-like deaminating enzyme
MPEIVIVGGGVIGASIAYHLTAKGARDVVLLERGTIGGGETSKSGGFVQTHWDVLAEVRLIARSRDIFHDWSERIGGDCGFVRGGYLHVTGTDREPDVRRVHQMLLDEGLESQWIERGDLATLQPLINLDKLVGGAWEPTSGWADPVATTKSLAEAARRQGADVREGVTVVKLQHAGGKITGVQTTEGSLACRIVILAAGPWTLALHPEPAIPLPIELERGQVCYMSRPNNLPVRELGFYDEVTGLYTHPAGDTNLVGRDRDFPFEPVPDPDNYRRDVDAKWVVRAAMALGHRFPALRESLIRRGVTGLYDFTPDGQPIVDAPLGMDGYYVAAGFSGVGFKSAPATGLGVAELVLDGKATSVDLDHLRLARFATWPAEQPPHS